jgi:hypothetical protein
MRDGDDGAALHELAERRADQLFGLNVKAGGRLVEQQDPCIFEEGPGNGDALTLSARQLEGEREQRWTVRRQLRVSLSRPATYFGAGTNSGAFPRLAR